MTDLEFRPLTPETWDALATLFAEGGDPKFCWCAFWRQRGLDWSNSTAERNRALLRRLAERQEIAPGLVAFRGERAVGWVSVGPREDYERLEHSKVLARVDDRPVWSIVCFVVARRERGRGVAAALLEAAGDYARDHGARLLEAYPVDTSGGGRVPSATVYTGTLGMFERAGFEVIATRQPNQATRPRPIVRRVIGRTERQRSRQSAPP